MKVNFRLNPCSNGIQKYNNSDTSDKPFRKVLILVLMEYKNTFFTNLKKTTL